MSSRSGVTKNDILHEQREHLARAIHALLSENNGDKTGIVYKRSCAILCIIFVFIHISLHQTIYTTSFLSPKKKEVKKYGISKKKKWIRIYL